MEDLVAATQLGAYLLEAVVARGAMLSEELRQLIRRAQADLFGRTGVASIQRTSGAPPPQPDEGSLLALQSA
jgi:hypothetical protein